MSILQSSIVPASAGGYEIANSLRFNDDDSAYLSRTPASAGNRKTWTWSGWVKRGGYGSYGQDLFRSPNSNPSTGIRFSGTSATDPKNDGIRVFFNDAVSADLQTTQIFRDSSAWYHIVLAVDTTQATSSNRVKLHINGVQVTNFSTANYPVQNYDTQINLAALHYIGGWGSNEYLDGYLAEVNFVDGQALTPADFGETDEDYGHWKAKKYTGTYGTNGFYLDFKNSGSLGNDASSNSNNWTPNNLAATDQMLDSPTNNFCTLNPLNGDSAVVLSEGNLKVYNAAGYEHKYGTFGMSSGKWYWETVGTSLSSPLVVGIDGKGESDGAAYPDICMYLSVNGYKYIQTTGSAYGATWGQGDIIGTAFDSDNGTITFYKNGVSQGQAFSGLMSYYDTWFPAVRDDGGNTSVVNFGQDSSFAGNKTAQGNSDDNGIGDFYYTPPTGFLALCTQNLPEPTVIPSEHFNTVLYTGNSSTNTITGVGFQPDWSWLKARSVAYSHNIFDVIRGANKQLYSNVTSAEVTDTNSLMSFDNDGFTLNDEIGVNSNGHTYASWNWKANGAGVSNTDGSITSTVSANVDAGFSIVKHTGNKSGAVESVGHGLTKTPELIIQKTMQNGTQGVNGWLVGGTVLGNAGSYLFLNLTNAIANASTYWGNTLPDATNFYVGTSSWVGNDLNIDHINYCFHSVEGYSKVGSYTGNGSTDGTFVHCGFRPAYVLIKCYTASGEEWEMYDNERLGYNPNNYRLNAHSSASEGAYANRVDIVSNGFKLRTTANPINGSGKSYIFIAFAENPMKYSNAR